MHFKNERRAELPVLGINRYARKRREGHALCADGTELGMAAALFKENKARILCERFANFGWILFRPGSNVLHGQFVGLEAFVLHEPVAD